MATMTIEVDSNSGLVRHIEDLQRVITKRNKTIDDLTARLEAGEGSEYVVRARQRGYKDGWRDCSNTLIGATADAARALGQVRKEAFETYLQSERAGFVVPTPADIRPDEQVKG